MAQRYYFFNSTTGDRRKYQAQHLAEYFGSVLSSGLIHINNEPELLVNVETGTLNTVVDAGKALIKGHLYENTTPLTLEHSIPEANLDRIDRIVLRLDLRNSERNILLHVKEGSPSADPEPPELQRDNFIHELSLAQIRVRANTSSLDVDDLQDERLIDELCGLVQSMISLPTTRFQEQWDAFMDSVKDEGYATLQMLDDVDERLSREIDDIIEDYVRSPGYASASQSGNVYSVTLNPAPTQYKDGMGIVLKATNNTNGQPKINVNGLGTKNIFQSNGLEVPAFKANTVYTLRYNGSNFILQGEGGGDGNFAEKNFSDILLDTNSFGRINYIDEQYYYMSTQYSSQSRRYSKITKQSGTLIDSVEVNLPSDLTDLSQYESYHNPDALILSYFGTTHALVNNFIYNTSGTLILTFTNLRRCFAYIENEIYAQASGGIGAAYNEQGTLIRYLFIVQSSPIGSYFEMVKTLKRPNGQYAFCFNIQSNYCSLNEGESVRYGDSPSFSQARSKDILTSLSAMNFFETE